MCSSAAVMSGDSTAVVLVVARTSAGACSCRSRQAHCRLSMEESVAGADGSHDFQEEVVTVAAGGDGWLAEPAVESGAAGRGEAVDDAVGLDLLRLALRIDQAVAREPVEYLVQVTDGQPAPLVADSLLEAAVSS